LRQEFNSKLK